MKKLLSLFLILVFCISLVACKGSDSASNKESGKESTEEISESNENSSFSADDATDESSASESIIDNERNYPESPALYKVTDDNGNIAWLFGSIHVGDESFYPLPEYVTNAFNASDALAVEVDIIAFEKDIQAQTQALTTMIYKDGTKISDHIPEETYEAAKAILQSNNYYVNNYYVDMLDLYMPCFWESLISSFYYAKHNVDTDNGIDKTLLNEAKKGGKKIYDIESAEFQYGMLAGFSDDLQASLLQGIIESYNDDSSIKELDSLKSLWCKGDSAGLKEILYQAEYETDEEKKLMNEYNKAMYTDRNLNMTNYAENALKSGEEVFICVGAAHVIGADGMVELLAQRGYKVERVTE